MKLWLDDERPMPMDFDIHTRSAEVAWELIKSGIISFISFDHDLGDGMKDGTWLSSRIEKAIFTGEIVSGIKWTIHSANPVGRVKIRQAMENMDKWSKMETNLSAMQNSLLTEKKPEGYPTVDTIEMIKKFTNSLRIKHHDCYELLWDISPDMECGFILQFLNGVTIQVNDRGTLFPSLNNEAAKEYFFVAKYFNKEGRKIGRMVEG